MLYCGGPARTRTSQEDTSKSEQRDETCFCAETVISCNSRLTAKAAGLNCPDPSQHDPMATLHHLRGCSDKAQPSKLMLSAPTTHRAFDELFS